MRDSISRTPEAKPTGAARAPDSLEAAAAAFQTKLFPPKDGAKRKPEESNTPEPTDEVQPEVEETEETQPEAEEATETTDSTETVEDVESTDEVDTEETEEPEAPETTEPAKRSRKMKFADGTEKDVDEDEAYQGYLRTEDYTRKSQANAELKRQLEADRAEARANAARHAEQLAAVKANMDRLVPKEPNWPELRKNLSPEEYANVRDEWSAFKAERDRIEAEQQKIADEQAADYDRNFKEWRAGEIEKLKAAVPEWVDTQKGAQEVGEMAKYMLSIGYEKSEVDNAVDHRFLLMLRKAWLWDKAQKVGKTKVDPKVSTGKIKSAPPGGKATPAKPKSSTQRAQEALRKSGSLKDAANVFQQRFYGPKGK